MVWSGGWLEAGGCFCWVSHTHVSLQGLPPFVPNGDRDESRLICKGRFKFPPHRFLPMSVKLPVSNFSNRDIRGREDSSLVCCCCGWSSVYVCLADPSKGLREFSLSVNRLACFSFRTVKTLSLSDGIHFECYSLLILTQSHFSNLCIFRASTSLGKWLSSPKWLSISSSTLSVGSKAAGYSWSIFCENLSL